MFLLITRSKCKKYVDNGKHTPQYLESVMLLIAQLSAETVQYEGKSFRRVMMPAKKKAAKKKKH